MKALSAFALAAALSADAATPYLWGAPYPRRGRTCRRPRGATKSVETAAEARKRKKAERQRKRDGRRR